jgi:hypothetical protein
LTKRALPCACDTAPHLQSPPDSVAKNVCPLPACPAPDAQSLLGYAYGAEDACTISSHSAPWRLMSAPPPSPSQQQALAAPILLSHLPLHRNPSSCGSYPDSKPITPNFRLFSPRPWAVHASTMPMQSSARLLRDIQPLLVLSGDHHRWCTTLHSINSSREAVEVTVGTFSWLQGSLKPSFGALLFTNSSASAELFSRGPSCVASSQSQWHAVVCPCWLPDNRLSLTLYAVFAAASIVWLLLRLGCWRNAIKTWLVTCAAAVTFHVLLL